MCMYYVVGMLKKSHKVVRHNLESMMPLKCIPTQKIRKFGRAWTCGLNLCYFINKTFWILPPKQTRKSIVYKIQDDNKKKPTHEVFVQNEFLDVMDIALDILDIFEDVREYPQL